MHKLHAGKHIIRSRNKLFELELSQDAIILDQYEGQQSVNYRDDWRQFNNPAGDWTIELNGETKTICTNGKFRLKKCGKPVLVASRKRLNTCENAKEGS